MKQRLTQNEDAILPIERDIAQKVHSFNLPSPASILSEI